MLLVISVDVIQFVLRCPAATRCVEGRKAAVADPNRSCFARSPKLNGKYLSPFILRLDELLIH